MSSLSSSLSRVSQTAKSAVLVMCGVAGMARSQMAGEGAVLAFHGLREDEVPAGVSDEDMHVPVSEFRRVCQHLAGRYQVMPLTEMAVRLRRGEKLPARAVALTFDDGYASNYHLGFPVLRELGLPATMFLATGFLDGDAALWFQQVDLALRRGARVTPSASLGETLAHLKTLPDEQLREEVRRLTGMMTPLNEAEMPAVTRPMTWGQVREMRDSGLVEFGGHTHTHPVLARCGLEKQAWEIQTCRDRLVTELGTAPRVFAYPNGGPGDSTADTERLVESAGFESAWTMVSGRAKAGGKVMSLPRYGAPRSVWEAEATVSGGFELMRKWRGGAA